MTPGVKPLIAGNWKMNGTRASLAELQAIAAGLEVRASKADALLCVPFTLVVPAVDAASGTALAIGAQDCHAKLSGAHTGDVSAEMIADAGATHVIVGHSERRTDHREGDGDVKAKAEAVLRAGLTPIVCIGETKGQREAGETLKVLEKQLADSLPENPRIVVAYEPVWAIGTGLTPTASDVESAHALIRKELVERYGKAGSSIRILYGGSVKPANAGELLAVANVDGALVGGASLKSEDFLGICDGIA